MAQIRIGLSGWSYPHWNGRFYPSGLKSVEQLAFVAERFDTVEVNRSFYSLLEPAVYRRWHDAVPDDFVFAVKGGRFITHMKKLNDPRAALGNFFASGVLELGAKLGPVLWQLPGNWQLNLQRIAAFLELLPHTFAEACEVARGHDSRAKAISIPDDVPRRRIRHALEARHPTWFDPQLTQLLAEHEVALVSSHSSVWPYTETLTADFVYLRLHGPGPLYASAYDEPQLAEWAERLKAWHAGDDPSNGHSIGPPTRAPTAGRDVFVYFDNDGDAIAPRDARRLRQLS